MNRNLSSLSSRGFLIRRATLAEHDKPILHIDMDNCSVDFASGIAALSASEAKAYEGRLDEVPGIFSRMNLMPGFIDSFNDLKDIYDIYFLSTAPWNNPSAWSDKLETIKSLVGEDAEKRLILSHNKQLVVGDVLVDDRPNNGANAFAGKVFVFGSSDIPNWTEATKQLKQYALKLRNEKPSKMDTVSTVVDGLIDVKHHLSLYEKANIASMAGIDIKSDKWSQ